jgi:hypothetical protein
MKKDGRLCLPPSTYFSVSGVTTAFTAFSNLGRASITKCPQPQHFIPKSMPVRKISHS